MRPQAHPISRCHATSSRPNDKSRVFSMKPVFFVLSLVFISPGVSATPQSKTPSLVTRCGWFSNPTPSNASLFDRDAEWTISVQGGYQAEGDWPEFGPREWVETNVHYGYGCACMNVGVDRSRHVITKIVSSRALSLATCRQDRFLNRWDFR